jgi:predicted ATP-grasp superfamily ATP-dependent carboligase
MQNAPAIVIGGGSANGLGIARNLGRQNIPVYCVTSNPHELMLYSAFCHGSMIVPNVEKNPRILKQTLQQLTRRFRGPGVLFPTSDTALLTVTGIREALPDYVTFIPPRDVVETMVMKTRFYKSLRAADVPHPLTLYPNEVSVQDMVRMMTFPVFIRPAESLPFYERFRRKGFVARNVHELQRYLQLASHAGFHVLVQDVIPGVTADGYTFRGYLDHRSQLIVLIASQKIRQPSTFANTTVLVTIPRSQTRGLDDIVLSYFQQLGYTGLYGVEFKRDPRDGQFKLLEVNARSMGGSYLGAACGANDIYAAYRDALGDPVAPALSYTLGLHYIELIGDSAILVKKVFTRDLSSTDLGPYRAPKHFHLLSRRDPLPFFKELFFTTSRLPKEFVTRRIYTS